MGRGRRRQGKTLRRDRHRNADHFRAVHDCAGRLGTPPRAAARPELLGARSRRASRLVQLRSHRLPLLQGPRGADGGVQGRRVRPHQGVLGTALDAPAQGPEVGRRAHRQAALRVEDGSGRAGVPAQPATAAVQRHAGAAGARADLRLREHQPLRALQARVQPVQQHRVRRAGVAERAGAEAARAVPRPVAAGGVRPVVPAAAHRQPAPTRCARTCAARATCLLRPAGSPTPTECCATQRARLSSSST